MNNFIKYPISKVPKQPFFSANIDNMSFFPPYLRATASFRNSKIIDVQHGDEISSYASSCAKAAIS